MSFGARLADARKRKGLTQEGLGKGLGTDGADASKSVVYGWEKDQHYPRVDQLVLICQKLGCSADHLLFGKVEESHLPAELADLAQSMTPLQPRLQRWVISTLKTTIEAAYEAQNGDRHTTIVDKPSTVRSKRW